MLLTTNNQSILSVLFALPNVGILFVGTVTAQETSTPHSIRALPTTEPMLIDGTLVEGSWLQAPAVSGFRCIDPNEGTAASFETEVRICFDNTNLYIGAFCHDTLGFDGVRVPSLSRDFDVSENDLFGVIIDSFGDGRMSFVFQLTPHGNLRDQIVFAGLWFDVEWDGVWEAKTTIADSGWSVEIRIPWTTLRYPDNGTNWRVNFHRQIRRLNEMTAWSPWPRGLTPYRTEYCGSLEGIEPPSSTVNVRVQPYLVTKHEQFGTSRGAFKSQVGFDGKWVPSTNTALDLTVNTDFAQVEVDRQVINVSRFSVFFPERRPFFLENANLFSLGITRILDPFFSRRIGLETSGRPIPVDAGVRLTGKTEHHQFGALVVRQRATSNTGASTFGVGRYVHSFGGQNRIGGMLVSRSDEDRAGHVANNVLALDSYFRFGQYNHLRTLVSGSMTKGRPGDGIAAIIYPWHSSGSGYFGHYQVLISKNYNAATGFVTRNDIMVTSPAITLDWRPDWKPSTVRSFRPGFTSYWYHSADFSEFQEGWVRLRPVNIEFENGSWLTITVKSEWQNLKAPFEVLPGITLAPGKYRDNIYSITYQPDLSKPYWAYVTVGAGTFFNARNEYIVFRASPLSGPRWNLTIDYAGERYRGLGITKTRTETHLASLAARFAFSPQMQVVALCQYNNVSAVASVNLRFSYEFAPLSYLYFVLNDSRLARTGSTSPFVDQQQLVLKITYAIQL